MKAGADIVIEDFSQITSWHLNDFFLPNTGGWVINFQGYDPKLQPLREVRYNLVLFTIQANTLFLLKALCVLGNGYMATRGNVEEAVADTDEHYPGILHNKFYSCGFNLPVVGTYLAGGWNRAFSQIENKIVSNEVSLQNFSKK